MDLHSERLVANGPYQSYVRNPLYLGVLFLSARNGLHGKASSRLVRARGRLGTFCLRLALREEAALTATQGESCSAYKSLRTIPSLTPRLAASGRAAHWRQALAGETFMWAFAVATLFVQSRFSPRLTWEMTVLILCLDTSCHKLCCVVRKSLRHVNCDHVMRPGVIVGHF